MALLDNSAATSAMYAGMSQYHLMNSRLMASATSEVNPATQNAHQAGYNQGHHYAGNPQNPNLNSNPNQGAGYQQQVAVAAQAAAQAMAAISQRFNIEDISIGRNSSPSVGGTSSANSSGHEHDLSAENVPSSSSPSSVKPDQNRRSSTESVQNQEIGMTMSLKLEPSGYSAGHQGFRPFNEAVPDSSQESSRKMNKVDKD